MSETTTPLTLALSKGRIFEETMPLLAEAGIEVPENPESSRKLILPTSDPGLRLIIVRASDVPTYVQYGAADLGIAGKDVLIEHAAQQPGRLYQPIDLNIAKCRLAVAVRKGFDYDAAVHQGARLRVATCKPVQSGRIRRHSLYGSMDGAAGRPGRLHRRPGLHRRHAARQRPGGWMPSPLEPRPAARSRCWTPSSGPPPAMPNPRPPRAAPSP